MDVTASNAAGRAGSLGNLGLGLRDRYAHTGAVVDLDLAITAFQQALELTPAEHPDRPGNLNNLGLGLHDLYLRTGSPSDLEAAIAAFQAALEATPAASADRPMYLGNLGTGLRLRYATTGMPADLEAAIEVYRQAVDATPIEAIGRAGRLTNLGTGLNERYARTGDLTDLEAAITAYEQALEATPAGASNRPMYLTNLGGGLHDRYARTGSPSDLEAAIAAFADAVEDHRCRCRRPAFVPVEPGGRPARPLYGERGSGRPRGDDRRPCRGHWRPHRLRPRTALVVSATWGLVKASAMSGVMRLATSTRRSATSQEALDATAADAAGRPAYLRQSRASPPCPLRPDWSVDRPRRCNRCLPEGIRAGAGHRPGDHPGERPDMGSLGERARGLGRGRRGVRARARRHRPAVPDPAPARRQADLAGRRPGPGRRGRLRPGPDRRP